MILEFFANIEILIELSEERADSPEDLLIALEDALERGDLDMHQVRQFLLDYNSRSSK